jgi:hypothetical protein
LNGKANPKEDVEFDQAFVNLVMCIHLLDLAVSTKELVNLPPKFAVYFPAETDISNLSD